MPRPARSMFTQVPKTDLRGVVLFTAFVSALWLLFATIASFQVRRVDQTHGFSKLQLFDLVTGIMFAVSTAIEVFGIVAAATRRLPLIRIYAFASVLSLLSAIAAYFINVIVHFTSKSDILNECINLTTGTDVDVRFGFFGPSVDHTLTQQEATSFCNNAYSHDSWAFIVQLLIEMVVGGLFCYIAIAYYRQAIDPTSATNSFKAPSNAYAMQDQAYHGPYGGGPEGSLPYNAPWPSNNAGPYYNYPENGPKNGPGDGSQVQLVAPGQQAAAGSSRDMNAKRNSYAESVETLKAGDNPFEDFEPIDKKQVMDETHGTK